MGYQPNKLTGTELGVYLGILGGIAVFQTTEQFIGLALCPIIGLAFGMMLDWLTHRINIHLGFAEED